MVTQRILNMTPSATSTLGGKISEMKAAGIDIVPFHLGEPDFSTPEKVQKACTDAIKAGETRYTAVAGILPLRQAISEKLEKDNNLSYAPDQICVSTGAKGALYNTIMALCQKNDEVIIPVPCWVSYVEMVKLAEAVPVLVPTKSDFQLDIGKIAAAVTPRTRAVIINTPNNPTGAVYSEAVLRELAKLAVEKNLYIISDEVYEKLIYDGKKHISIASLSQEICDRTVTINGFSKTYSMTGWRLGYAAGPKEIIKGVAGLQSHMTTNATAFVQYAAITALEECDCEVNQMKAEFEKRRDYMYQRLEKMKGVSCPKPGGAFYLMPVISTYFGKKAAGREIKNSADLCDYILEEAKTAIVPGDAFGMPEAVRLSYSTSVENIKKGMDRLEAALSKLE